MSALEKIKDIEAELGRTQKNKATMSHIMSLKAKLAKYKRDLLDLNASAAGGGGGDGFEVKKTGDARVGLVGFPSVGKSTLLMTMTDVYSEVASYEFTTLTCIPGVIKHRGAKIQMLDLPGIVEGAKDGRGRGRQVIATARTCTMLLIVLDAVKSMNHKPIIEKELEGFGIRLNQRPPGLTFRRKDKGGVTLSQTFKGELKYLDQQVCRVILSEYRIANADIVLHEDCTGDQLIDVIEGNRVYMPCVYVLNKLDAISIEELEILDQCPHYCPISAHLKWNLDGLLDKIWEYLHLVRVYTKPRGITPDYDTPVILSGYDTPTIERFILKIHKSLLTDFKHALVWGSSAKHNPQVVGKDHVLQDEDVVQIIKKL
mmetsp:Transcript_16780/g.42847  ORF Transcript_16780/g.42847 Transcript_16780/m.42847 type:complete len:372 (+) Transcript_16780:102-1217(+)